MRILPRSDVRVSLRLWPNEYDWFEATARRHGVATGALIRAAAMTGAAQVERELTAGMVQLRKRSSEGEGAGSASDPAPFPSGA